jgi:two-component system, NarL family, sensor kinase
VVGLLLAATEIAIYVGHPAPPVHADRAAAELWHYVAQGSALIVAGLLVLAHRAAPAVGWMLLGPAVVFVVAACLSTWLRFATAVTPAVQAATYAEYALWEVPRIAFIVLPLCFPHGRLPTGRVRWFALGLVAVVALSETSDLLGLREWRPGATTMPNALYVAAWAPIADHVNPVLAAMVALGALAAAFVPVTRWRNATEAQHRQIAVVVPVFVLLVVEETVRTLIAWSPWVFGAKIALGVLGPAALAYSVIRDRLYDLDRAARRVIGVAVPAVLLAAVYLAAAATMSLLLPGDGTALPAVLAVLAALVGLVLRPAAHWVQRRIDHLLYGDRAEPYQLARHLADSLRDGADAAQVPLAVCQIAVSALRLPAAELVAVTGSNPRRLALVGDADVGEEFDLRYQGRLVGYLRVAPRTGESALDELDAAALGPLVDLAAPAVSAILLAEELESSRARVASAREDERSRLRRDVHDGIGPSLAAIRLQVDTAAVLLPPGSPSGSLLARISAELGQAVAEIGRVTENLRPPVLDERGLAGALTELVDRLGSPGLPIALDLPTALPPLPPAVELAAYRITAEALANAIRHAAATRIRVDLAVRDGALVLRIRDDGLGLRAGRVPGVGLASMAQRAADLGGTCDVDGSGRGTTVTAHLPLAANDDRVVSRH